MKRFVALLAVAALLIPQVVSAEPYYQKVTIVSATTQTVNFETAGNIALGYATSVTIVVNPTTASEPGCTAIFRLFELGETPVDPVATDDELLPGEKIVFIHPQRTNNGYSQLRINCTTGGGTIRVWAQG